MFLVESEEVLMSVKPMNCPGHMLPRELCGAIATCRCGCTSRRRCIATRLRACSPA